MRPPPGYSEESTEFIAVSILLDIDDFAKAIEAAFEGKAMVLHRMRLSTTFYDKEGQIIGEHGGQSRVILLSLRAFC